MYVCSFSNLRRRTNLNRSTNPESAAGPRKCKTRVMLWDTPLDSNVDNVNAKNVEGYNGKRHTGQCKKERPKRVVFFTVLIFFIGNTLKLEKQFLKKVKNIFHVYTYKKKVP